MNKRIKIKKGLAVKKCDDKCYLFRLKAGSKCEFNNACIGCIHKPIMDKRIENNYNDISSARFCECVKELNQLGRLKGYPYFEDGKCFGIEITLSDGAKEDYYIA